jgi:hypothetical protein
VVDDRLDAHDVGSVLVPVPFVRRVSVSGVHIVDVVAVEHRSVPAALAVLVGVPVVRDVPARFALVPVPGVLSVQVTVVRVVDVVVVRHRGVAAGRAVDVLVDDVFLMSGGHGAHLRDTGGGAWPG